MTGGTRRVAWGHVIGVVGIVAAIVGIAVMVVLFARGECTDARNRRSELEITATSYGDEVVRVTKGIEMEGRRFSVLRKVQAQNADFMKDIEKYDKMTRVKAMLWSAIERTSDPDLKIPHGYASRWKEILTEVGFELKMPQSTIMSELSDSIVVYSTPTETLLATPGDARQLIGDIRRWQGSADRKAAEYFQRLLEYFGSEHPSAGKDLENFLVDEISDLQQRRNNLSQTQAELEAKQAEASRMVEGMSEPAYCGII